jgi:phenylpropionate dioxygenase-like ring-hydroxylating dioxygenase large terminal subunit
MFINFWYVAEESGNVKDKPVQVRMLGQEFVVFRDLAGIAHCLSNTCIHRGASLANGRVEGDCIECPYHGWRYSGDGLCQVIPSMNSAVPIGKRRVDSYPTVERYGLIFVFLGDLPENERPPIMAIPEWGRDGWRATAIRTEWNIDYIRSMENAVDPGHNEFVHTTHIQRQKSKSFEVPELELIDTEWGTGFHIEMPAPPMFEKKMREVSKLDKPSLFHIKVGLHGVSSFWTYIQPHPQFLRHSYFFETPVNKDRTRIFFIDMRNNMLGAEDDERVINMDKLVMEQDGDVIKGIRPIVQPLTNIRESLVPADRHVLRFRELLQDWQARGWRIDVDAVKRTEERVAYAIPCPARREHDNWVLAEIPLHGKRENSL